MRRLHQFLFVRHRHNWVLLGRFAAGGRLGRARQHADADRRQEARPEAREAIVGMPVHRVQRAVVPRLLDDRLPRGQPLELPAQPHRGPSARASTRRWWREYWPFLAVGLLGQLIGLVLLTLLMHRGSPLHLSPDGVRRLDGLPHPPLLGPAHRHRRRHARLVRAQQAVDVRGRAHPPPRPRRPAATSRRCSPSRSTRPTAGAAVAGPARPVAATRAAMTRSPDGH